MENYGWHRIAGPDEQSETTMLQQTVAAKVAGRTIDAFCDNGVIDTLYVM